MKEFKFLGTKFLKEIDIALIPKLKIVINNEEKQKLLKKYHDDPILGGHCGRRRLYLKLKMYYYWKNMTQDIYNYVSNCKHCQENKVFFKNKEPLEMTETPTNAFDIVFIDTIGPNMKTNDGNIYAITMICALTKYLITIPIPDKSAKTIAKAVFEKHILIYGPMKVLGSDRGTEYVNEILTELCKLFDISRTTATSYHHRSMGTVERVHRTFNEYVRSYINTNRSDWDIYLSYFTYCFNTTPSDSLGGYCPFTLIFGKLPNNYEFLNSTHIDPIYNFENYHTEVKFRLQYANKLAHKFLEKFKQERKFNYDKTAKPSKVNIDDKVLIENEDRKKFDPMYKGPYIVKDIQGPNALIFNEKTKKEKLVHKDKIKILTQCFYYRYSPVKICRTYYHDYKVN